ncbi:glucose-methanol-choline oxidoreductase [Paenibacillus mucilaginosus 3016]|uniref:Glucose-methanol-choline oxidoreductase n=1 Tax=Paenibacillus mucilaginosus 3016 TaxID=1116391 RepID=H6NEE6_9BACL|nr:GMC family oxidoreductase [Paenibacillus mucilaginosus]AFC28089.1 glucose-methanol-choline oxidoreductase [Paenibacillus mucilaginosus 3016]WFA16938.1 GMC family oxidoreductase [Paenibacillus mucilaginosus]
MSSPFISECPEVAQAIQLNWLPLASLDEMEHREYDVLIVGSGAGGGAALWRMCQRWGADKRIGVIEAGDTLLDTHARNISTLSDEFRFSSYLRAVKQPVEGSAPDMLGATQVTALGGKTLFWTAIAPRPYAGVLADWPVPMQELNYYFGIAEQFMNVRDYFSFKYPMWEVLLNRLQVNGFPQAKYAPRALDFEPLNYKGTINSNVYFSSIQFLGESLNLHPYDLAVQARATRILTCGGRACGVEVMRKDKSFYRLKAKNIILAAGAFQTPRLLLHSAIPGPSIGHYLQNHSYLRVTVQMRQEGFAQGISFEAFPYALIIPQTEGHPYQIQVYPSGLADEKKLELNAFGSVEPRYANRITLDPYKRDEYGVPIIKVDFSYSYRDWAVMAQMSQTLLRAAAAWESVIQPPGICLLPPGADNHESGTCRMGIDPYTSATNPFGQIHNITGLFVADNSVFPGTGGANPTLSTIALAIRTADYIAASNP